MRCFALYAIAIATKTNQRGFRENTDDRETGGVVATMHTGRGRVAAITTMRNIVANHPKVEVTNMAEGTRDKELVTGVKVEVATTMATSEIDVATPATTTLLIIFAVILAPSWGNENVAVTISIVLLKQLCRFLYGDTHSFFTLTDTCLGLTFGHPSVKLDFLETFKGTKLAIPTYHYLRNIQFII